MQIRKSDKSVSITGLTPMQWSLLRALIECGKDKVVLMIEINGPNTATRGALTLAEKILKEG